MTEAARFNAAMKFINAALKDVITQNMEFGKSYAELYYNIASYKLEPQGLAPLDEAVRSWIVTQEQNNLRALKTMRNRIVAGAAVAGVLSLVILSVMLLADNNDDSQENTDISVDSLLKGLITVMTVFTPVARGG